MAFLLTGQKSSYWREDWCKSDLFMTIVGQVMSESAHPVFQDGCLSRTETASVRFSYEGEAVNKFLLTMNYCTKCDLVLHLFFRHHFVWFEILIEFYGWTDTTPQGQYANDAPEWFVTACRLHWAYSRKTVWCCWRKHELTQHLVLPWIPVQSSISPTTVGHVLLRNAS